MLVLKAKQDDRIKIIAPGCEPIILVIVGAVGKIKLGFDAPDRRVDIIRANAKNQERKQKESE